MNKTELAAAIAEKVEIPKKDAEAVLNAMMEAVGEALKKGDKIQLIGFGSFEVKERAARVGRNPKTLEEIKIPASKYPVFKAGKALKDQVAE
ncbi:MAG: HU family DNA-binding protein [Clostridiaceae bacterium]|jgi:DNA-binding protein HU-beta|nr:HU family DNA-binding protein [Clostridiaceae bacterium]